jgi:hypothetical protein
MNRTGEFRKYREDSSKQRIQELSQKLDLLSKIKVSPIKFYTIINE